jgi:hypothetical protein
MPDPIIPRADGLITRDQAATLCGVTPEAITNWTRVGYGPKNAKVRLPVRRREHGRPLYDPVDVQKAEHATARRARRDRAVYA